jgi:hypothetical protein
MSSSAVSPFVAKLLLAFSVIAFLASIRAIVNSSFRNKFLRDPRYLRQGTPITLASAVFSALWWAVISVFLTLSVFNIHSNRLENILGPVAACLLLAAIFVTYYEYRKWKRLN